jgi:hypothetical protein
MSTIANTTTPSLKPAFTRVQQTDDCNCAFACIAMLAGKTLEEVRQVAIDKFKHPKHGPYWIGEDLISKLLIHFGWVGTVFKASTGLASLPDTAIGMCEYNSDTEIGRHVLFNRVTPPGAKQPVEYIIDPAYWVDTVQQIRTDIKGFPISWYIGVHPMAKTVAKTDK